MFWRAETWQQLLQLSIRTGKRIFTIILHRARHSLSNRPRLIVVALVLVAVAAGLLIIGRASSDASASSTASASLPSGPVQEAHPEFAQIATRTPTRRAATNATSTATLTATSTGTATATPTDQATPRPPTPTWTPLPTATQVASSPLGTIAPTTTPTGTVTGTADIPQWLVPTPTPTRTATATPTLSINEALELPVPAAGLAGLVATATAAIEATVAPETNTVTQPGIVAESAAAPVTENGAEEAGDEAIAGYPLPAPTVASQPTPDGNSRTVRVPILMYHYLSIPPRGG